MAKGKAGKPFRGKRKRTSGYYEGWKPFQFRWYYPNSPSPVGRFLEIKIRGKWRKFR